MLKQPLANETLAENEHHQSSVQSVRRAIQLLRAFGPTRPELGVSELSRLTGLHKTTVYRLLVTLEEEGLIKHIVGDDKYRLGPGLIRLGRIVLDSLDLGKQALPHMRALVQETDETAMLEIWDDGRTLVVASVDGRRLTHVVARPGNHLPAHGSSGGKLMLAFLPAEEVEKVVARGLKQYTENTILDRDHLLAELENVRRSGVGYDRQEIDIGICAASAPIFDHRGEIAGALTVAGPTQRLNLEDDGGLTRQLRETAARISRELGYAP